MTGLAVIPVVVGALSAFLVVPAAADVADAQCGVYGHTFSARMFYATTSDYHEWRSGFYVLGGSETGGNSEMTFTIKENDTARLTLISRGLENGALHNIAINPPLLTRIASRETATFYVKFDVPGPDPSCTAKISM